MIKLDDTLIHPKSNLAYSISSGSSLTLHPDSPSPDLSSELSNSSVLAEIKAVPSPVITGHFEVMFECENPSGARKFTQVHLRIHSKNIANQNQEVYDIMYHRACEINEFRSFDLTYLISALVFLPLLFFFSDQRLPNFLYFNSSAYLEKLGRIKQLKASLDMTKYDPRFLDNRREYRSLNSLSIQGINDYILHESDNNQLPTQESNCSNALKDLESYKRLKQ